MALTEDQQRDLKIVKDNVERGHRWLYYSGQLYEQIDMIYFAIEDHVVESYLESSAMKMFSEEMAKLISRHMKSEFIDHIKSRYFKRAMEIQEAMTHELLPFNNCYLDFDALAKGEEFVKEYHAFEDYYFFAKVPHNFNIEMWNQVKEMMAEPALYDLAPIIHSFLEDITGPENMLRQLYKISYCFLHKNIYKVMFLELGETNAGKTTYIRLLEKLVGERNVSHKSMQDISNYPFTIHSLFGKLANIYDDLPKTAIRDTGLLKMLTGESIVTGHRKFKEDVEFKNYSKMIFTMNKLPYVYDLDDNAFFGRIVLTKYTKVFPKSDYGERMLNNESEIEGLICACVLALRDILIKNVFESMQDEYSEFWKRSTNTCYAFVKTAQENNELVLGAAYTISKEALYGMYSQSCDSPLTQTKFTQELSRLFQVFTDARVSIDGKRATGYRGIGTPPVVLEEEKQVTL